MNHKVKELFNTLYSNEDKEHKTNPKNKENKMRGFVRKGEQFNFNNFTDETYFIICNQDDINYPTTWDNLEIDFNSQDIRYCKECDKTIHKVSNGYMYQKCKNENLCMAISTETLKNIKNNINITEYEEISNIILISKLFLEYEDIHMQHYDFYEEFKENNFTRELAFKAIILDILNTNNIKQTIEYYNENGVDLEKILFQVVPSISDDKFKIQVEEKITKLITKDS